MAAGEGAANGSPGGSERADNAAADGAAAGAAGATKAAVQAGGHTIDLTHARKLADELGANIALDRHSETLSIIRLTVPLRPAPALTDV
jgi:hypothetical protein